MHFDVPDKAPASTPAAGPWYRELTRYHWFVFVVAALGWLFDTMDQQLFNLARVPAMRDLLPTVAGQTRAEREGEIALYAGYATSIFLIGWATGGLFFGILGDRIGRVKTMLLTIITYSIFTGLSALSQNFWQFALLRFLTGLGVGGEFAVGVALVAEVMPSRARPFALGLLQALSAVGNITAALISMTGISWQAMFLIGTAPALLSLLVRRRLKEPERWQAAAHGDEIEKRLGSVRELFADPRWRRNALVGLMLASAGVIGLWGIGFFSIDLNRTIFRRTFEEDARHTTIDGKTQAELDREFVRLALAHPGQWDDLPQKVAPGDLLNSTRTAEDAQPLYATALGLHKEGKTVSPDAVLKALEEKSPALAEKIRASGYLDGPAPPAAELAGQIERITARRDAIAARLGFWAGVTSLVLNIGAFFGIYLFSEVSSRIGRRPTFAVCFVLALLSTAMVFWYLGRVAGIYDVFWMIPIMGFCQLSLFGGYAIYFPELFPTRLRSTGTSFCYNVGRFVAALGPLTLGILTSRVFVGLEHEPMRYAGVAMCGIFLVGLVALPFAPETRGKPLPE